MYSHTTSRPLGLVGPLRVQWCTTWSLPLAGCSCAPVRYARVLWCDGGADSLAVDSDPAAVQLALLVSGDWIPSGTAGIALVVVGGYTMVMMSASA